MLLEQMVEVKWRNRTKEWYESKGYKFTKLNDTFTADINDITGSPDIIVKAECDFCKIIYETKRNTIISGRERSLSKMDCCSSKDCDAQKRLTEATIKQNKGLLSKGEHYYWYFEENRIKEALAIANEFGNLEGLSLTSRGYSLLRAILHYDGSLSNLLSKNGLRIIDFKTTNLQGYYSDFDNLKNRIEELIEKYGRFPSRRELCKEGIDNAHIMNFGGMFAVKERMGYVDDNDLVDDSGFPNRSTYEYIVAQWLIHNNIKYSRELLPFNESDGNYRSDFTLWDYNNIEYHVEIWGYGTDGNSSIEKSYAETKNKKLSLYSQYNINLIEIEYTFFKEYSYDEITKRLYDILGNFTRTEKINIHLSKLIRPNKMTDEEILEIVMTLSDDITTLPPQPKLRKEHSSIYHEIIKRHSSYKSFAQKFNKKNIGGRRVRKSKVNSI